MVCQWAVKKWKDNRRIKPWFSTNTKPVRWQYEYDRKRRTSHRLYHGACYAFGCSCALLQYDQRRAGEHHWRSKADQKPEWDETLRREYFLIPWNSPWEESIFLLRAAFLKKRLDEKTENCEIIDTVFSI